MVVAGYKPVAVGDNIRASLDTDDEDEDDEGESRGAIFSLETIRDVDSNLSRLVIVGERMLSDGTIIVVIDDWSSDIEIVTLKVSSSSRSIPDPESHCTVTIAVTINTAKFNKKYVVIFSMYLTARKTVNLLLLTKQKMTVHHILCVAPVIGTTFGLTQTFKSQNRNKYYNRSKSTIFSPRMPVLGCALKKKVSWKL